MNSKLLQYIPKEYKPYVEDIYYGDRVWNEHTHRWNTYVTVEWRVGDEYDVTTYQNATHMYDTLKQIGSEFVDSRIDLVTL